MGSRRFRRHQLALHRRGVRRRPRPRLFCLARLPAGLRRRPLVPRHLRGDRGQLVTDLCVGGAKRCGVCGGLFACQKQAPGVQQLRLCGGGRGFGLGQGARGCGRRRPVLRLVNVGDRWCVMWVKGGA